MGGEWTSVTLIYFCMCIPAYAVWIRFEKCDFQVILLDTRYHRDPLFSDGSILGTSQWLWLEKELRGPATELTIIGSSIQVIKSHFFFFWCLPLPCKKFFPQSVFQLVDRIFHPQRSEVMGRDGMPSTSPFASQYIYFDMFISNSLTWNWVTALSVCLNVYRWIVQVISNVSATTGPLFHLEAWGRFPKERERLFKLIDESKVKAFENNGFWHLMYQVNTK